MRASYAVRDSNVCARWWTLQAGLLDMSDKGLGDAAAQTATCAGVVREEIKELKQTIRMRNRVEGLL